MQISSQSFKSVIFLIIVLYFTLFYDFLKNAASFFSYLDELIVAVFLLWSLFLIAMNGKIYLYQAEKIIFFLLVAILGIGIFSSYFYAHQGLTAVVSDMIIFYKPFLIYFSTRIVFNNFDILVDYKKIYNLLLFAIFVIIVFVVYDLIFDIFPKVEYRFGIPSIELFFSHPSRYAFVFSLFFILLFPVYSYRNSKGLIILFTVLVIGILSTRYKYIVFLLVSLGGIYIVNKTNKINLKKIVIPVMLVFALIFYFAIEQFMYHFSQNAFELGYGRAVLEFVSLEIANDHFPLGSGFSTFASYYSGVYYSPLYFTYGISNIYGLSEEHSGFIADSFIPMLIAQIGYIGTYLYFLVFYKYYRLFIRFYNIGLNPFKKRFFMSGILILIYLSLDSISDSIITQNRGMLCFFILAIFTNISSKKHIKNKSLLI
jgi:hypothetical protein